MILSNEELKEPLLDKNEDQSGAANLAKSLDKKSSNKFESEDNVLIFMTNKINHTNSLLFSL